MGVEFSMQRAKLVLMGNGKRQKLLLMSIDQRLQSFSIKPVEGPATERNPCTQYAMKVSGKQL